MKKTTKFLFLLFLITFFISCQKDSLVELPPPQTGVVSPTIDGNAGTDCENTVISIRTQFETLFYESALKQLVFEINFGVPDWSRTDLNCDFFDIDSVLIVPLLSTVNQSVQSLLIIDKTIDVSTYNFIVVNQHHFTTVLNNIESDSIPVEINELKELFAFFAGVEINGSNTSNQIAASRCPDPEGCDYDSKKPWWKRWAKSIISFFSGGSSSGGTSTGPNLPSPGGVTFWANNGNTPSTGGNGNNGGGSSNEPQLCSNTMDEFTFEELELVLDNIAQFTQETGLSHINDIPLINLIQPDCINTDYAGFRGCMYQSIACHYGLDYENYQYLLHFYNEFEIGTIQALAELIGNCEICYSQESYNFYAMEKIAKDYFDIDFEVYKNQHDSDNVSKFVVREVVRLLVEQPNLSLPTNAPDLLDQFYRGLNGYHYEWIANPDNKSLRDSISQFLLIENSISGYINYNEKKGIIRSLITDGYLQNSKGVAALNYFIHTMDNNLADQPIENQDLQDAVDEHFPIGIGPIIAPVVLLEIESEVMYLRKLYEGDPSWTDNWLYAYAVRNVFSGATHTLLDLCGLYEGPGIICDGVNALFYLAEGDGKNAAISTFAMVPFLGMTGPGQRVYKGITGALGRKVDLRFVEDAAGVIHFSYAGQLAKVIGKKANHQAHHLIPWAHNTHDVVQLAARHGWHPNDFINGLSVHISRHNGSHKTYNDVVEAKLDELENLVNGNGAEAVQKLENLAVQIYTIIESSTDHVASPQIVNAIQAIVF